MSNQIPRPAPIVDEKDASLYVGLSRSYLRIARMQNRGPAYVRIGRTIRYRITDLDTWIEGRRVRTRDVA